MWAESEPEPDGCSVINYLALQCRQTDVQTTVYYLCSTIQSAKLTLDSLQFNLTHFTVEAITPVSLVCECVSLFNRHAYLTYMI